ncbi:High mobility group B protein 15 [Striga hermonthica]|uniref:High mobility group B protein 15 n=1 Tax=Striga hermonthica TaxID=68872 RepID=A0A9N7RQ40_STRHE|nr:High mobility group B protein 15 [Striga hermonthica]
MMMSGEGSEGGVESGHHHHHPYPPPLATYEDVVGSRDLFTDTLKKFHASMGTKFMIPIVGGRDLDLHHLFVQVTSRGGIAKVLKDKRWKEVTSTFSFPSSATNASFILRKYYVSLLYHFEQTYLFKAKCWTPSPSDTMQHLSANISTPHGFSGHGPPAAHQIHASASNATSMPQEALAAASAGSAVCGVIDGKFESGYLITVKIGVDEFKGVLYQVPTTNNTQAFQSPQNFVDVAGKPPGGRRKRRKKSEIRKRDPSHPKPNRSGYNFFFAEQHAKLKPLYHGKDREISRIIGETWNKLQEPERAVYQEKAVKDKERYRIEMEGYRERLRSGQIGFSIPPRHHQPPIINLNEFDPNLVGMYEVGSGKSSSLDLEDETESAADKDFGECSQPNNQLKNVDIIEDNEAFHFAEKGVHNNESLSADREDGVSVPIEEYPNNDGAQVSPALIEAQVSPA